MLLRLTYEDKTLEIEDMFSNDFVVGFTLASNILLMNENSFLVNDNVNEYIVRNEYPSPDFFWKILKDDEITIYKFSTTDFIDGFITVFNYFNKDFRDYIVGLPYTINDDNEKQSFTIDGFDIPEETTVVFQPAPVYPFYTGSYQEYAIDYE
jgi:hypothetical protein